MGGVIAQEESSDPHGGAIPEAVPEPLHAQHGIRC
jgi:hypothetical protein